MSSARRGPGSVRTRWLPRTLSGIVHWTLVLVARALRDLPIPPARKTVWAFGGFGGSQFADNSAALFAHVTATRPDVDAVWIGDPSAPRSEIARRVGTVLPRRSLSAYLAAMRAEACIHSHGLADLPRVPRWTQRGVRVFVGHGYTGMKGTWMGDQLAPFDLLTASSSFEAEAKRADLNSVSTPSPSPAIVVTGHARFDRHHDEGGRLRPPSRPKSILYFPTWRDWLDPGRWTEDHDRFLEGLASLVAAPGLARLLEKHDAELVVQSHRNIGHALRERVASLDRDLPSIRLLPDEHVEELSAACDVLVTDYSGLAFEGLYRDRPVVFYRFDEEKYRNERGLIGDTASEPFGPVVRDADQVVTVLDDIFGNGETAWRTATYVAWRRRAFVALDGRNAERTVEAVERFIVRRGPRRSERTE